MPRGYQRLISIFMALSFLLTGAISVSAYHEDDTTIHPWADDRFEDRWERTDRPVAEGVVARTWIWGPSPFTEGMMEPYLEAPGGMRLVQYTDKSRMELLDPSSDDTSLWTVTQGLLALDMMLGRVQVGDAAFATHSEGPSMGNVAGDPGPNNGPTYATMGQLIDVEARAEGTVITERISVDGQISTDAALASYNVTAAERVTQDWVDHTVASVFWDFMNSEGIIWDGDEYETDDLFMNPFYAVGLPTTEAYWTTVRVAGDEMDVLVQCFERRCLTYAPENPEGWMVEAGNVGQHYFRWLETHVGPLVPVIASELNQPRHLLYTDHGLYIAEAGIGGDVCHEFEEEFQGEIEVFELCVGPSSSITRIDDGEQIRVVEGLPSIWNGADGTGAHDVTFDDEGNMYVVIGMGGAPEMRDVFGEAGELLATVVRVDDDDDDVTLIADLAEYEAMENPDPAFLDTNPYAIDFDGEDLIVVDAGGNSLLRVDPDSGDIETIAVFPARMVPAPPFIPAEEIPMESVPSDVVVGPDGNYYVSELTGFPFPVGEARVYQVTPDGDVSVYADGFTNIGSIDFDSNGHLIVLELVAGGLLNVDQEAVGMGDISSAASRVIRINENGTQTDLMISGIYVATGLSIGASNEMYIAHLSILPMAEVVRIDVPTVAMQIFSATMSGGEEVPPVTTTASGSATFTLSQDRSSISYQVNVSGLDNVTMAHIHLAPVGVNGGVVVWLYPDAPPPVEIPGTTTGVLATGTIVAADLVGDLAGQSLEDLITAMEAGNTYVNVHTTANPGGEIRGQIGVDHNH